MTYKEMYGGCTRGKCPGRFIEGTPDYMEFKNGCKLSAFKPGACEKCWETEHESNNDNQRND